MHAKKNLKSNLCEANSINPWKACLRPDLYGIPGFTKLLNIQFKHLYQQNIFLLGTTQLNCFNQVTKFPLWAYQRLDPQKCEAFAIKRISFPAPELPEELQRNPGWEGKDRGHLNHFKSCENAFDASDSLSQLNIVARNKKLNNGVWNLLEQKEFKHALDEKLIAHITTIPTFKENEDSFVLDTMCKVVHYEKDGKLLKTKCYLLPDDSNDKSYVHNVSLGQIEAHTKLKF